ncbi:Aste57867_18700 [Aphanomyces stellatus]|uniref:Aste57867_18700 protein n=1 Tax=Aphanomyces stellatus TaxID=120398 RepID=A0A485LES9_9STRA|nr:hypothetical protein As57867_018637 [Aphanomyces stellatus]VFT95435.1 Aste57867_18700 [Aphanomyces stellatus]
MVRLEQLVPTLQKTPSDHVHLSLMKSDDGGGGVSDLLTNELHQLCARHTDLHGCISAVMVAADELSCALHATRAWRVSDATGKLECPSDPALVARVNEVFSHLEDFVLVQGGCSGSMQKEGGYIKTWKRRHFQLTGQLLHYFASAQDVQPKGGGVVVDVRLNINKLHALDIQLAHGRVLRVVCDSSAEMRKWFKALAASKKPPTAGAVPIVCMGSLQSPSSTHDLPRLRRHTSAVLGLHDRLSPIHVRLHIVSSAVALDVQVQDAINVDSNGIAAFRTLSLHELDALCLQTPRLHIAAKRLYLTLDNMNDKVRSVEITPSGRVHSAATADAAHVASFNAALVAFYVALGVATQGPK